MMEAGMGLGGDLLVLSSMTVEPKLRGNHTGHATLKAILGTVARNTALVILEAAPLLTDNAPEERSTGTCSRKGSAAPALDGLWLPGGGLRLPLS
ncbi:hypothetical protein [Arthrobacter sp. ISL-30]|uniref:hypothetical protein n=1 Tax=Arthrobacter sp. ISL-30 TaxID=2819109 RepID=UPI001BE71833|nr:hypothetical protein [Arthrobacter sp. ISL-30]MBT2514570.1 hypothetical protein [Arthrobacter sp. ISL-30]